MSELLKAFYIAYAAWLDNSAPQHQPFSRNLGLCGNLHHFAVSTTQDVRIQQVFDELDAQFVRANLSVNHPFNLTIDAYFSEKYASSLHANQKRIQWVRDQNDSNAIRK